VTLRIGHRGEAAPENTIASFRRAVELGAQAVALDVQRTKYGHLVVNRWHRPRRRAHTRADPAARRGSWKGGRVRARHVRRA
jgi:glycerophosphoryl diester phosphodiesterase